MRDTEWLAKLTAMLVFHRLHPAVYFVSDASHLRHKSLMSPAPASSLLQVLYRRALMLWCNEVAEDVQGHLVSSYWHHFALLVSALGAVCQRVDLQLSACDLGTHGGYWMHSAACAEGLWGPLHSSLVAPAHLGAIFTLSAEHCGDTKIANAGVAEVLETLARPTRTQMV